MTDSVLLKANRKFVALFESLYERRKKAALVTCDSELLFFSALLCCRLLLLLRFHCALYSARHQERTREIEMEIKLKLKKRRSRNKKSPYDLGIRKGNDKLYANLRNTKQLIHSVNYSPAHKTSGIIVLAWFVLLRFNAYHMSNGENIQLFTISLVSFFCVCCISEWNAIVTLRLLIERRNIAVTMVLLSRSNHRRFFCFLWLTNLGWQQRARQWWSIVVFFSYCFSVCVPWH